MRTEPVEAGVPVSKRIRRWPFVVGAVLLGLGAVGAWAWFRWLPNHRPALQDGERYGVDVSSHQDSIDWDDVAADDILFAYVKATEGGDFVDERFDQNWEAAGEAGLDRGAYHFFTLCTPGDEQAANFLDVIPAEPGELPPALDLELAGNCSARPDGDWVDREVATFLDEVEEATGQAVVLYIGSDFEGHYSIEEELDRPIWHRRILRRPDVDGWWIWQAHDSASIDGIDGGADLNVMRGNRPPEGPLSPA